MNNQFPKAPPESIPELTRWHQAEALNSLAESIHTNAREKGFYQVTLEMDTSQLTIFLLSRIALIHSELSEALEAARIASKPDRHCPAFDNFTIELADTIIRILDLAAWYGADIGGAVTEKHAYNQSRPHMHGKNS